MSDLPPRSRSRRGHRRSRHYTNESMVLDAGRIKRFLKSNSPTTVLEFPGMKSTIDLCRVAEDRLVLRGCPPPLEEQQLELLSAHWGPHGTLRRFFFRCPWCERRAAKLFVPHGGSGWGCRTCHGIVYRPKKDRLDVLLTRHAEVSRRIEWLIKLRARAKTHVVAPATADEVERHVETLLSQVEALDREVEMQAGVVGL